LTLGKFGKFGKDRRLRASSDFRRVQRAGKRVTSPHFVFLVAARPEDGPSRMGLVVSRKVGNAVARNRIKRLCRECFRLAVVTIPAAIDLVIIPRGDLSKLDFASVSSEWADVQRFLQKRAAEALAQSPPRAHVARHKDDAGF